MSSMHVFTRKWGSPICHALLGLCKTRMFYWLYKTCIGRRSYSSTTDNLLDFYTNKLGSIYRHKLNCHLLGLDKTSSVAYNSGETQTCNYLIFFFTFRESGEILASVWQEEGNFEVLKRCNTQIYSTNFLLCFGKAVNLQPHAKLRVE